MIVGLNVLTNPQMYRQNSEKALLEWGLPPYHPPPPQLVTARPRCIKLAFERKSEKSNAN